MSSSFRLLRPGTVEEASVELLRLGDDVAIYAGGVELLLLLRQGIIQAPYLLDVKSLPDMHDISWDGETLTIGACVSHRDLERQPLVGATLPLLVEAERHVGNPRVRSQGTLGGNLCFADPHADPATALLVHDTTVTLASRNGTRQMALDDFLIGTYEVALEPGELLGGIRARPLPPGWTGVFLRFEQFYRPTLNVAAAVESVAGRLEGLRLAVGCVGPRATRLTDLEERATGLPLEEALRVVAESEASLTKLLEPVDDQLGSAEYKMHLTRVLLRRAIRQAAESQHAAVTAAPAAWRDSRTTLAPLRGPAAEASRVSIQINEVPWQGEARVDETLLELLRATLGLTGTKRSCESEVCGACTVLVDGQPVSSCTYLAFEAHGRQVATVEGLSRDGRLHPLQEAFIRNVGAQCGYCTPGQLMAAQALLSQSARPSVAEVRAWMSGNICRCGCYAAIEQSILEAAQSPGA